MKPIRYGSVCSGVEAASLAWMPLGWEAVWFSEIEPFPCAVLTGDFDGVVVLPGWKDSRGSVLELLVAQYIGLKVFPLDAVIHASKLVGQER